MSVFQTFCYLVLFLSIKNKKNIEKLSGGVFMISLKISDFRISEIAKIISKYPIKSSIQSEKIIFNGDIPEACISELLDLGLTIEAISNNEKSEAISNSAFTSFTKTYYMPNISKEKTFSHSHFIIQSKSHATRIPANTEMYKVIYPSPKCGEIYWVDFGQPFGYEEAFIRPALVVKSGGVFKSVTTVIPMSSQIENYTNSKFTPIFSLNSENVVDYIPGKLSSQKYSCLLVEQIRTVDNSRLRGYIGSLEQTFLNQLMENVQNLFQISYNEEYVS